MKTKILSLVLFLLTTLGAAAEQTVHVAGSEHGYPLGATSWMLTNASGQGIVSGSIEWKADEKVLVLSNLDLPWVKNGPGLLFKGDGEVTVKVNGYAHIYHRSNAPTVNTHAIQTYSDLRFVGTGNLQLQKGTGMDNCDIKVETSYTHLTIDGPKVICVEGNVTGASDKTTDINVLSGGLEIHASAYRAFKHMAANIRSIKYGSGIGMKQPHGAYLDSDGTLRKMSGEAFKKDDSWVDITKVADYGFSIQGYEINESNFDLLDKPSRYFPNMDLRKGSVKFVWKDNTVYLEDVTLWASIENRSNGGLKINVKGNNKIVGYVYLGADMEINGTGTFDMSGYSLRINKNRQLTVLTDFKARNMWGEETTYDNQKAKVCIEDRNGNPKGVIELTNGTHAGDPYTFQNLRLVDHWGKESKFPVSTTKDDEAAPVYIHNAGGKSGVFANNDRSEFCKGPVTINGRAAIYPIEINGRYVTAENANNIIVPEGRYKSDQKLSYDPTNNSLTMEKCGLYSLASGNTPIIKHTEDDRHLFIIPKGQNNITCYAKCPFMETKATAYISVGDADRDGGNHLLIGKSDSEEWQCGMIDARNIIFQNLRRGTTQYVKTEWIGVFNCNLEIADLSGEYDADADVFYTQGLMNDVHIDTSYGYAYYGPLPKGNDRENWLVMSRDQKVKFSRAAATEYDIKVMGQQVTSFNKDNIAFPGLKSGRLVYVPAEQTLLLDHVYIENNIKSLPTFQFEYGDFTVNAVGENKIVSCNEVNMGIENGTVTTTGHALQLLGNGVKGNGGVYLLKDGGLTIQSTDVQGSSSIFEFVEGTLGSNTKLNVNSPAQFLSCSNQSKKSINVNTLSVSGMEAKYPLTISGGTVVDGDGNAASENVQFVKEGTNPIYPSTIILTAAAPTLTKKGSTSQVTADIQPTTVTDNSLIWLSSNEEVATVDGNGLVKAVGNGVATITAQSVNGTEGTVDITVAIPDPEVITLDKTNIWFKSDYSGEFITATVEPADCDQTVTWTSSNEDVVTVSNGRIALVSRIADEGTATLTATTVNGLTAQCEVRVHYPKYAEELTLDQKQVRLTAIDQEAKVQATVGPGDIDYELLGYSLDKFGDTEVADVEISNTGMLTIVAKKEGNMGVAVHATCDGEENLTGAFDFVGITVKPIVNATALALSMDDNKFYQYGERRGIIASFTPGDVDSRELQWSTNDKSVATVDENGVVTSVGEGTCTITAKTTDGSALEAKQIIYVYNPDDYSIVIPENIGISLTRREMTLFPNQRFEMQATLTPASANTYVKWEVESLEGDGGRVEVFYDEEGAPKETLNAELSAYVMSPSDAVYPIKARVIATALGAAAEPLVRDTCIVTILNDIYFTQANADGVNINYHVVKADPQDMQVELYGTTKVQKVNGEWTTVTVPAVDTETTGTLTVPSQVTYEGQSYWVTTLGSLSLVKNKIEELVLPEGLTTIKENAVGGGYYGYEGFLKKVNLPSTLKHIGNSAFNAQSGLKDVYMNAQTAPTAVDEWGYDTGSAPNEAFAGIASDAVLHIPYNQLAVWNQMPWSEWFSDIDDGSYLTQETAEGATMSFHISSEAQLTAEVKGKPSAEPSIKVKAVADDVTAVTIPSKVGNYTVTSIDERAFEELANLKTVTIPESITEIGASAFQNCAKLDSVTIYCTTPPAHNWAFSLMDPMAYENRKLVVPYGCKQAYEEAQWNMFFGVIEEMHEEGYVPDTNTDLADNIIYTQNMEVKAGQKTAISIRMKNNVPIRAFQFKLFLPNGVEAVKNSKNKFLATLNRERLDEEDEHTLSFAKQKDGSILFLCGSLYDENFAAGDGEIISLPVQVADDLADGNYALTIQQITMTETDISKNYQTALVKSTVTVGEGGDEPTLKGDVNDDGIVSVLDYTSIANYILGEPDEGFNEKAGDVNDDGVISVLDYTEVANIILGDGGEAKPMRKVSPEVTAQDNILYIDDMTVKEDDKADFLGQEYELPIRLKSTADIRGFQFDLYLPEGIEAVKSKKGKYTLTWNDDMLPEDDEHTLNAAAQKDGAVRFLCSSLYDETFVTGDDVLFTIKVKIADNLADGQHKIQLKNMTLTQSDISKHYDFDLVESTLTIGEVTGIASLRSDRMKGSSIFNLAGQRVEKAQKGLYIVNGKKVVVK